MPNRRISRTRTSSRCVVPYVAVPLCSIIPQEFYARCRASQELISAQIPWAFAQAERSREAAGKTTTDKPKEREGRQSVDRDREQLPPSPKKDKDSERLTTEEKLLAAILASNEELLEALRLYDDLERVGIERDAEERSKREIRMDRSVSLRC